MPSVSILSNSAISTVAAGGSATINVSVAQDGLLAVALVAGGNFGHAVPKYNGLSGANMTLMVGRDVAQSEAYIYVYPSPALGTIPFYFSNSSGASLKCQVLLLSGVKLSDYNGGTSSIDASSATSIDFTISHTYLAGQLGIMLVGTFATVSTWTPSTVTTISSDPNFYSGYRIAETDGTTQLRTNSNYTSRYAGVGAIFNPAPSVIGSQVIWWG